MPIDNDKKVDLKELLPYIAPASLDYGGWARVGMALKKEGYPFYVWDDWSQQDARYNGREMANKWESFGRYTGADVSGAFIVNLAKDGGWVSKSDKWKQGAALDWNSTITADAPVVVDAAYLEIERLKEPAGDWRPLDDFIQYMEALFAPGDFVGYVVNAIDKGDGHYAPADRGIYRRTAGDLISAAKKRREIDNTINPDMGYILGTYRSEAGAWIRFNPLDGHGVKNDNVTAYKHALVESDTVAIEKQRAIIDELRLPVAAMVYSGGKSVHAIVKIDARNFEEYRERVDYLYKTCEKNGLKIDTQNRNPSRLSRLPGVWRGGKKQFLISTNTGCGSWDEWEEYIEGINDNLPEPESLAAALADLPEKSPELIADILRQGHKLLIAGASKAGKSFLLIQLCIAIAEGRSWIGHQCARGRVLYVNLEVDRASCLHRFYDVYQALGIESPALENIDIWNLRGKSAPMDKLAPKLIRRAKDRGYMAIVIDPIYKVITGDENSADEMARFCNQFDLIATSLETAVIYCHHHSKGHQGGKRSMDRASGSGVFARDPDALLDMTELTIPEEMSEKRARDAETLALIEATKNAGGVVDKSRANDPDFITARAAAAGISAKQQKHIKAEARAAALARTAWRIEGTLREFRTPAPVDVWFEYPIHRTDAAGELKKLQPETEKSPLQKMSEANASQKKKDAREQKRQSKLEIAYSNLEFSGAEEITLDDLADQLQTSKRTVQRYIKESGNFEIIQNGLAAKDGHKVKRKEPATDTN